VIELTGEETKLKNIIIDLISTLFYFVQFDFQIFLKFNLISIYFFKKNQFSTSNYIKVKHLYSNKSLIMYNKLNN